MSWAVTTNGGGVGRESTKECVDRVKEGETKTTTMIAIDRRGVTASERHQES